MGRVARTAFIQRLLVVSILKECDDEEMDDGVSGVSVVCFRGRCETENLPVPNQGDSEYQDVLWQPAAGGAAESGTMRSKECNATLGRRVRRVQR